MNRIEVLDALCDLRDDEPIIIGPGLANYPVAARGDHPLTIYNMDMPYAAPIALGMALAWPTRRVVAIEGDGSLLAGPGVLSTMAGYRPNNFVLLVFDNGAYLTTGSGRVATATTWGADIEQLGRASGLTRCRTVSELPTARAALEQAFREPGPWLIVARVDTTDRPALRSASLPVDVFESALRFRRVALEQRRAEQGNARAAERPD